MESMRESFHKAYLWMIYSKRVSSTSLFNVVTVGVCLFAFGFTVRLSHSSAYDRTGTLAFHIPKRKEAISLGLDVRFH